MYIITESDSEIKDTHVVGLATDLYHVQRMIAEYMGEDATEVNYRDIRDSGLEFEKTFYITDTKYPHLGYYSTITVLEFTPNEI